MAQKEEGFAHFALLIIVILVLASAVIPINRNYNNGKSSVAGVSMASVDGAMKPAGIPQVTANGTKNETFKEMENELDKEDIQVATAPGQMALVNKRIGALTNFPISVDPSTKQLTVTTPAGVKTVAVLPQQAVDNMLAAHVMDSVTGEKVNNSLASIPNLIKLEIQNGVLGYQISGTKTHRLLGFIPIKTGVNAFVSAENGQVVTSNESLLGRILDKIAPNI